MKMKREWMFFRLDAQRRRTTTTIVNIHCTMNTRMTASNGGCRFVDSANTHPVRLFRHLKCLISSCHLINNTHFNGECVILVWCVHLNIFFENWRTCCCWHSLIHSHHFYFSNSEFWCCWFFSCSFALAARFHFTFHISLSNRINAAHSMGDRWILQSTVDTVVLRFSFFFFFFRWSNGFSGNGYSNIL